MKKPLILPALSPLGSLSAEVSAQDAPAQIVVPAAFINPRCVGQAVTAHDFSQRGANS
ncbi:MAG: hypothetical protein ABIT37_16410 [Luteolibacter sp.]